jgi:hypothetical protein
MTWLTQTLIGAVPLGTCRALIGWHLAKYFRPQFGLKNPAPENLSLERVSDASDRKFFWHLKKLYKARRVNLITTRRFTRT